MRTAWIVCCIGIFISISAGPQGSKLASNSMSKAKIAADATKNAAEIILENAKNAAKIEMAIAEISAREARREAAELLQATHKTFKCIAQDAKNTFDVNYVIVQATGQEAQKQILQAAIQLSKSAGQATEVIANIGSKIPKEKTFVKLFDVGSPFSLQDHKQDKKERNFKTIVQVISGQEQPRQEPKKIVRKKIETPTPQTFIQKALHQKPSSIQLHSQNTQFPNSTTYKK